MLHRRVLQPLICVSVVYGLHFIMPFELRGDLVVISISRGVGAASTGGVGDFDSTALPGDYIAGASSVGSSPAGTVGSFADQISTTPAFTGPTINGTGSAEVFASATGFTGFSNFAESFFDVVFTVTDLGIYSLDADVDWIGGPPPPYFGFATVELHNVTSSFLMDSIVSTPTSSGPQSLVDSYLLAPGVVYRLYAEVEIGGGFATAGEYATGGNWTVLLTVPEPSSVMLIGLGGSILTLGTRRRFGRRVTT